MKKAIGLVVLVAIMAILVFGMASVVAAVPGNQNACDNSQGAAHASENGIEHASDNSVLKRCAP